MKLLLEIVCVLLIDQWHGIKWTLFLYIITVVTDDPNARQINKENAQDLDEPPMGQVNTGFHKDEPASEEDKDEPHKGIHSEEQILVHV